MVVGDLKENVELVVIGGGPGGYAAAFHAADLGKDVALVEQESRLGGTCLLRGCIPSKAMITAAEMFHKLTHSEAMGIIAKDVRMDMKKMAGWRDNIIKDLSTGLDGLCKARGIRRYVGRAHFTSPNDVHVAGGGGGESAALQFQNAIIAVGSVPIVPKPFVRGERVLSSDEALALDTLPESVLVVGGGYIGIELGSCLAALGCKVTVVEMLDRILAGTDADLVRIVQKRLAARGVTIHLETKVTDLKPGKDSVKVMAEPVKGGASWSADYSKVLVAIGRRPSTDDCGLERTGVKVDKGFILVDEQCRTSVPHLFAIGDCAGQPMLAHRARRMGMVAAEVVAGQPSAFDNRTVPAVVFSDPEIAYCGLSEEEAKKAGYKTKIGRFRLAGLGRAKTLGDEEGMVFIIADADSEIVLGVRMVGPHVSELIGEATLAVETAMTLEDLVATIHVHPTLTEAIQEAAESARGESIHSVRVSRGDKAKAGAR